MGRYVTSNGGYQYKYLVATQASNIGKVADITRIGRTINDYTMYAVIEDKAGIEHHIDILHFDNISSTYTICFNKVLELLYSKNIWRRIIVGDPLSYIVSKLGFNVREEDTIQGSAVWIIREIYIEMSEGYECDLYDIPKLIRWMNYRTDPILPKWMKVTHDMLTKATYRMLQNTNSMFKQVETFFHNTGASEYVPSMLLFLLDNYFRVEGITSISKYTEEHVPLYAINEDLTDSDSIWKGYARPNTLILM